MPLHYADTKESTSKRLKHEMAIILGRVIRYETWEGIPEGVLAVSGATPTCRRLSTRPSRQTRG